jgi:hypothetical protein
LHMPAASNRDIRCWTGNFRKSKQSTGKCRSLHLVDTTQSVISSNPDPFRGPKSCHLRAASSRATSGSPISTSHKIACVFSARPFPLSPPVAAPDTPRSAPLRDYFPPRDRRLVATPVSGCSRSRTFTSCCPLSSLLKWGSA